MNPKKPDEICSTSIRVGTEPDYTNRDESQKALRVSHDSPPFWKQCGVFNLGEDLRTYATPQHNAYGLPRRKAHQAQQAYRVQRGKIPVNEENLGLLLHVIGREDDLNFMDQSKSMVKQNQRNPGQRRSSLQINLKPKVISSPCQRYGR